MSLPDRPQFNKEAERVARLETANNLNDLLRSGCSMWEEQQLRLIRNLPRPIVIDFNRVLVNARRPWIPNPEAKPALEELTRRGTVFVVTSALADWELRRQALENFGLWHPGMILITSNNIGGRSLRENAVKNYENLLKRPLSTGERAKLIYGEKRLAAAFLKPYEVPIIDDEKSNVINNPGMLGIQVRPFNPNGFVEEDAADLPSIAQAVEQVKLHYSAYGKTPFRDTLVDAEFIKGKGLGGVLVRTQMLENNPEVIVRMGQPSAITKMQERDFLEISNVLKRLQTQYGIFVPSHSIVIGPLLGSRFGRERKQTFYLVTERIHGLSLQRKTYSSREANWAWRALDNTYASVAQYLWDTFKSGGVYIDDIAFSNEQFMFGRRKGDGEDRVWFTDLGPQLMSVRAGQPEIIANIERLTKMIEESEKALGVRLVAARAKIFDFLRSVSPGEPSYNAALREREKLGDPEAKNARESLDKMQEIKREEFKREISPIVTELDIDEEGYRQIVEDCFVKEEQTVRLKEAMSAIGRPEMIGAGYVMRDVQDYGDYELRLLGEFFYQRLLDQVKAIVGEDSFNSLLRKYGNTAVHTGLRKAIEPRQNEIARQHSRILNSLKTLDKARGQAHQRIISELGWEEDVLPHLDMIKGLIPDDREAANHYLPLAMSQLGWDYHFPYTAEQLRAMFNPTEQASQNENSFKNEFANFVTALVGEKIGTDLASKLQEVESRYGEDVAAALAELIQIREVERILQ